MYMKNQKKLIQNKEKESRPPPFWLSKEIQDNHLFVTNMGSGARLGNQLFEFSSVFGVSKLNNRTPIIKQETWNGINQYFDARMDFLNFPKHWPTGHFMPILESECHTLINDTKKLPQKNVTLGLYLISRLYFEDAEEELRKELMFKDSVIDEARAFLNQSFSPLSNGTTFARVVIHVRRGDLLLIHSQVSGFRNLTSEYFSQSMAYFRHCYDRVQFVVTSDDMAWCKANLISSDVIYSEGHSPGVDLAISSLCDHAITTRGTFSIWAAWFANGITIRPLNAAMPNSTAAAEFKLEEESFPSSVVLI